MPKLTKRFVESLTPAATPTFAWDDQLKGFGVKVLPSGQRKYVLKYRAGGGGRAAPQRWLLLGSHGAITVDQARDLAQQALAVVARGQDPQADKFSLRTAPIMSELWQRYEADHLPRKKASSVKDDTQKWTTHIEPELGRRKVQAVTRDDIDRLHKKLADRPYQANRVVALLSKMFNLAERWGMRGQGSNPCRHVAKYKEEGRQRYLTRDELVRLGEAMRVGLAAQTETPYMVAAIRLLLLTGARVNEILTARWEWVDLERRVIRLPESKTGAKPLFLSEAAVEVLRGLKELADQTKPAAGRPEPVENPFVIRGRLDGQSLSNLAKAWKRLCARAGIQGVRIHDLRHTVASIGVGHGFSLPVVGRLLGHTQASTTQRYAHVDIDPAIAAADRIGLAVDEALRGR